MSEQHQELSMRRYLLSLLSVAILAGGGVYIFMDHQQKQTTVLSDNEATTYRELKKIYSTYDEITNNYVGDFDKDELIEGALKGMTDALDDPYSTYLNKDETQELEESVSGTFEGIGAALTLKDELPTIGQTPIKGTPADKAGLKMDDVILKVDGEDIAGETLDEIVTRVRGEKGSDVVLTIRRDGEEFDVTVTRDTISTTTVYTNIDKEHKKIGNIQIVSFGEQTATELKQGIADLRKQGATSFVIDVRQNPGGLLDQVEIMSSMFLKDGKTIVQFANKDDIVGETVASKDLDGGFKVTEPTVVLVNETSASASEIFAAALKESAGITIIGTTTFGKGTVQTLNPLDQDSELKLTVMKWLTPSGEWINETGLKPTIEVAYPEYALQKPISKAETLKEGDSSDDVRSLNLFLEALGYTTEGDTYTAETTNAVKAFQETAKLEVTGEVDEATATMIELEIYQLLQKEDPFYDKAVEELLK